MERYNEVEEVSPRRAYLEATYPPKVVEQAKRAVRESIEAAPYAPPDTTHVIDNIDKPVVPPWYGFTRQLASREPFESLALGAKMALLQAVTLDLLDLADAYKVGEDTTIFREKLLRAFETMKHAVGKSPMERAIRLSKIVRCHPPKGSDAEAYSYMVPFLSYCVALTQVEFEDRGPKELVFLGVERTSAAVGCPASLVRLYLDTSQRHGFLKNVRYGVKKPGSGISHSATVCVKRWRGVKQAYKKGVEADLYAKPLPGKTQNGG